MAQQDLALLLLWQGFDPLTWELLHAAGMANKRNPTWVGVLVLVMIDKLLPIMIIWTEYKNTSK